MSATTDMCKSEEATLQQVKGIAGDTPDNPIKRNAVGRRFTSARAKTYKITTTKYQAPPGHSGQSKGPAPATVNCPTRPVCSVGRGTLRWKASVQPMGRPAISVVRLTTFSLVSRHQTSLP